MTDEEITKDSQAAQAVTSPRMTDQEPRPATPPRTPAPEMSAPSAPAGWYPDAVTGQQRYWDGTSWTTAYAPGSVPVAARRTVSGMAVTGFVLSLVAICSGSVVVGAVIVGAVAVIFSGTALQTTRTGARGGHGLAIAGIIIGLLAILGSIALAIESPR